MDHACRIPDCSLYNKVTASPICLNCFHPTESPNGYGIGLPQLDHTLPSEYIPHPSIQSTMQQPLQWNAEQLSTLRATRPGLPQAVVPSLSPSMVRHPGTHTHSTCRLNTLQHPAPVLTPPLSTKSLSPNGRTSTHVAESGFVEKTRPQPSLQKTFDYYNPNAEKRSKEKSKRTCMSCYNRNDRKVQNRGWLRSIADVAWVV